jgi:rod shape determining protein RodA
MRRVAGYDAGLCAAVFGLLAISIYLLMTAITNVHGEIDQTYGWRQLVFACIGLVGAVFASRVDLELLRRYWTTLYLTALGSIAVVFLLGTAIRGSRRWIEAGPVNLQPSETGKVLVILAVAGFLVSRTRPARDPVVFASALGMAALPAMMVFLQPDFGTSQVYGYSALALVFFAGARWLHLGALFGSIITLAVLVLAISTCCTISRSSG